MKLILADVCVMQNKVITTKEGKSFRIISIVEPNSGGDGTNELQLFTDVGLAGAAALPVFPNVIAKMEIEAGSYRNKFGQSQLSVNSISIK